MSLQGSLSTVVGDEKLASREDLVGLLFLFEKNSKKAQKITSCAIL